MTIFVILGFFEVWISLHGSSHTGFGILSNRVRVRCGGVGDYGILCLVGVRINGFIYGFFCRLYWNHAYCYHICYYLYLYVYSNSYLNKYVYALHSYCPASQTHYTHPSHDY